MSPTALTCPALRPPKAARLWSLRAGGPWEAGLLEAFHRVVAHALAQLERAAKDPEKAVHEYRKAIRRARAVVRLVRAPLGDRYPALDGALRAAVVATSGLRDVDVLRGLVAALLEPPSTPDRPALKPAARPALLQLDRLLAARQEAQRRGSVDAALLRGEELLLPLPARFARALPPLVAADLRAGFAASYRRAKAARREARRWRDDDQVHAWRKRVKELRYQLELDPTADDAPERACWGDLAERLGAITDQVVLLRTAEELAGELGDPASVGALLHALRRAIDHDLDQALAASELQFARKPRELAATLLNG